MPVCHEVKSQLAKLLATEDLIVEQKKVETASFNTHTRVLTLPMWNASNDVYDMLVCHEVGHALYTPDKDTSYKKEVSKNYTVSIAYNKGAYQVIPKDDVEHIGK